MAKSKIVVTFNSNPIADGILEIGSVLATNILETFKATRVANYQTEISILTTSVQALYYIDAVNLDYNNTALYTITKLANIVTIEAVNDNEIFTEVQNTTGGAVTVVITNEVVAPPLTIDTIAFSTASSDVCNNVKVSITTSELATKVTSPVVIDPNAANPFTFDWVRASNILLACETATLNVSQNIQLPDILSVATTQVNLFNTPTGANLTVTHDSKYLLDLEYSLDNITFQTSNVFNGLTVGSYTIYVKDQLGCQIQANFSVSIFTPDTSVTIPFSYLAKEMSIRYKKNVVWDNTSLYKTEENTLSCEEKVTIAYKYYHYFQTNDIIITQFLSNYDTISANIIKEDGTKDALTVTKKSANIGSTDKRDAIYFNAENDQTGVYYTSGDSYDYSTGVANGTYTLNGALPAYGAIGNYIFLDALGWFQIQDIVYSEDFNADVLIIDYIYAGVPTSIIVSSLYNQKNYEVYEFSTNFSTYIGQELQIEILQSDAVFDDYNYLSEKIKIDTVWNDTIEFIWYSPTDSFVFYSTGLRNKARLYFESFSSGNDSSLEIHKTDTTTILISSESYETKDLELSKLSTAAQAQLSKAFLHKQLYLDGVQFVSNSVPETENVKGTNQYTLNANLTKTGQVYNSEVTQDVATTDSTELTGLLQDGTNYIKV